MQAKVKTKKSLGQNFIQQESIIQRIIELSNIKKDETVLEIGPGLGALTRHLLSKSSNVSVVEFDSSIIKILLKNCHNYGNPKIYNEDFLKFDISKVSAKKIKLIGNLPYNICSLILFKVVQISNKISDAHLMLQKEVVKRIIATPNNKSYGRLSVVLQYHFDCAMLLEIPPEVFYPQPKVYSAILRLRPKDNKLSLKDYSFFEKIVKQSFAQRRKTLHNNLKSIIEKQNINPNSLPVDTKLRAENLSIKDFVSLANFFS